VPRLIKGFAALATLSVVGTAMLLALLWREHGNEITLPAPTGHVAVGRTTYAWVNDAQTDDPAPSPGVKKGSLGLDLVLSSRLSIRCAS
jgi:hypothetical protein